MDQLAEKERGSILHSQRASKLLFSAGLILVVGWLGIKAWRISRIAQSLQSHLPAAEVLTAQGLLNANPEAAETLVFDVRRDVVDLKSELRPFMPFTRFLGWLPKVGPLMSDAEPLLEMADAGTAAAAYTVDGLKPALVLLQDEQAQGEEVLAALLPVLEAAEPDLQRANAALERVRAARAKLEHVEEYPWRIRTLLEKADSKLYLADIFKLLPVLPEMLGSEGRRTYLIMAQNEDEIRATGGFVTGAGLLVVEGGRIVELAFQDSNNVDNWREKPYDFPPEPLYQLMGLELFLFRDANFWPDFPTSAEKAMELYSYGQELPPVDGVIAIDQQFVAKLVGVTGPMPIPDLQMTVNNQNVIDSMRSVWGQQEGESRSEWVRNRKDFLGPFAQAVRAQLFGNLARIDLLFLAQTMYEAASGKHLQIYVRDQEVANVLDEMNWDGRLEAPAQSDVLMVVDTNVGYNKVNPKVEQSLSYHVTLDEDGRAIAELTLPYTHTAKAEARTCTQEVEYEANMRYEELMSRCFWNYLRVYVPPGSQLLEASEHDVPKHLFVFSEGWDGRAKVIEEPGEYETWANFFLLLPGETLESRYRYQLPKVTREEDQAHHYRLSLLKQAGQAPHPVEVQVSVPAGASIVKTSPGARQIGQTVIFDDVLDSDRVFTVTYHLN